MPKSSEKTSSLTVSNKPKQSNLSQSSVSCTLFKTFICLNNIVRDFKAEWRRPNNAWLLAGIHHP